MNIQLKHLSAEHIEEAASRTGMSAEALRNHLDSINLNELHGQLAVSNVTDAGGNCKNIDFDIKIFSIKGKVCFTPGSNWTLYIDLTLSVAGIEVANVKYNFSAANSHVCYKYDLLLVSLDVCFGVRQQSGKTCLYTSGTACGFGSCSSWNENIVCF